MAAKYDDDSCIFSLLKDNNLIQLESKELYLNALRLACFNNQHIFLQSLLAELTTEDTHIVELVKESCKYIACFQIFYYTNRNACFESNEILKHCLENKYMDTFWFILKQFNENELVDGILNGNLYWKNDSKTLLHIIFDEKKYTNQEIINVFKQLYELNLFNSLFFLENQTTILDLIEDKKDSPEILNYLLERKEFLDTIKNFELKLNSDNIILNS